MNRGCISLGDVHCDGCHRTVRYLERYLVAEDPAGATLRLCVECASKRDYVHYHQEKGERVTTFFPRSDSGLQV